MRKFMTACLTAIAIVSLSVSSVFAVGANIRGVTFNLGSLIADGQVTDMDPFQISKVILKTSGPADVICRDLDGYKPDKLSGHHPVVNATGYVWIKANAHGKSYFHVVAKPPTYISPHSAGCPHGYEKAIVDFVYFTQASITVTDKHGTPLDQENYRCETTRECVTCTKKSSHN